MKPLLPCVAVAALRAVPASAFDAVGTSSLPVDPDRTGVAS